LNNTGSDNTAVGDGALSNNQGANDNSAFGEAALTANTTGADNSAFGYNALAANTTAADNSAFGFNALAANTTAADNSAFGYNALAANTTAVDNSAFGYNALAANTAPRNSAFGSGALSANTVGADNTAVGFGALHSTYSGQNVAVGSSALGGNGGTTSPGTGNTAIGFQALYALGGTGVLQNNIAIGNQAGSYLSSSESNDIYIGNVGSKGENGVIRIGQVALQFSTYIQGISSSGVTGAAVLVDPNTGQLGVATSSRRYKEDIEPMADASDRLLQLRPVQFRYKKPNANGEKPIQYGLIAEEVAQVFPELVVMNKDGQPETVAYHLLPAMLLNELQKEHGQLTAQQNLIHDQAKTIAKLEARASEVDSLKARLADLERVTALLAKMNGGGVTVQKVSQPVADVESPLVGVR
jgi:hypothetical protein